MISPSLSLSLSLGYNNYEKNRAYLSLSITARIKLKPLPFARSRLEEDQLINNRSIMGIESRGCGPFRFQFNADGFRAVVDTVYSRRNIFDRNRLPLGLNRPAVSFVFDAVPIQGGRGIETIHFHPVFPRELSPQRYGRDLHASFTSELAIIGSIISRM